MSTTNKWCLAVLRPEYADNGGGGGSSGQGKRVSVTIELSFLQMNGGVERLRMMIPASGQSSPFLGVLHKA